jgi:hypothetical protein
LEFFEFLEDFRFVSKEVDPSEFTEVVNKTNIIFISSNRITSMTRYIRKINFKGALEELDEVG